MLDPDLVRVDLLRIKRKIYLSYPEGSQARKDFLLASKISEIGYLSKAMPTELTSYVIDEYKSAVRKESLNILLNVGLGGLLSLGLFFLHLGYPKNVWFYAWGVGLWGGFVFSIKHIVHIIEQWQKMKPFLKEFNDIQEKIKKLSGELKQLE